MITTLAATKYELTTHTYDSVVQKNSKNSDNIVHSPPVFANQCANSREYAVLFQKIQSVSDKGIRIKRLNDLIGLVNQREIDCKSSQETRAAEAINRHSCNESWLEDCVTFVKSRFTQESGGASIEDIGINEPTFLEAFTQIKGLRGEKHKLNNKLVSLYAFFDVHISERSSKLKLQFSNLWNVIIDLFRTVILYGYAIKKESLRERMIKVWLSYSTITLNIEPTKILPQFDNKEIQVSTWMKVVKYKLAAFATFAKDSDVYPKCPFETPDNPTILLDRDFTQWFKRIPIGSLEMRRYKMSLIDSLCRGTKKGAARSTDDDCLLSSVETFELFTEPRKRSEYMNVDMHFEIRRSVEEILFDSPTFVPSYTHCPSFSSCTENSVMKGGHVKIVKEVVPSLPREPIFKRKFGLLFDPFPLNGFNHTDEENPPCRYPLPSVDDGFNATHKIGELKSIPYLEFSTNPDLLGTDLDIENLIEYSLSQESKIVPIGLMEALKVRGITTPCALETWLLKPLQQYLSKQLLKHLCFAVTGTPLKEEHIEAVIKHMTTQQVFLSGDYDNATNNMIGEFTRTCVESICDRLEVSTNYKRLAVRSLCDNLVEFVHKDKKTKIEYKLSGRQIEAQPMGKILSFVVLCIINFAACRKSLEIDQNQILTINQFPGLINGDDCCFPISNVDHWIGVTAIVGLFNSIGKTFTSREFVEMNSRTFLVTKDIHDNLITNINFHEVPFINFGLMKGLVRSASNESKQSKSHTTEVVEACSRMGWCHKELVKGFDHLYVELDYLFKHYHNVYLLDNTLKNIPYYVPAWLGGLGLDPGPLPENKITISQLKCAKWIYQNFQKLKPKSMTLSKTCLIDALINKAMGRWFTQMLVEEEIPNFQQLETEEGNSLDLIEENQSVYTAMVEYLWRTRDLNDFFVIIDNNFKEIQRKISARQLYHNQNIWQMAYTFSQKSPNLEPLEWYKLWQQKQNRVKPIIMYDPVLLQESLISS